MRKLLLPILLAASVGSGQLHAETLSQSAQSELVLMIQQLQAEVRQLRGEIETQQYRMQKLEREQLERYRDMDRRLSALILGGSDAAVAPAIAPATAPAPVPAAAPAVQPSVATAPETAPAPATAPAAAPAISDTQAYASAFALVRERRFEEALAAFQGFVAEYPASDKLANAHYWIGEVELAQQKLEPARAAFQLVVDQFADHNKRPDALYKLGVTQDRLGDVAGRTQSFEQLIAEYPKSSAAGLARNYQSR
jgi:tol-pal system protein YbgF